METIYYFVKDPGEGMELREDFAAKLNASIKGWWKLAN